MLTLSFIKFRFEKIINYKKIRLQSKCGHFLLFRSSAVFVVLLLLFSSCAPTKPTTYFQDIQKDTTLQNLVSKSEETKIREGDLLTITVSSLSPENTALYNAPQNIVGASTGYLVDENGNIEFIKLGSLHVEGMTRPQLKKQLEKDLSVYLKEPVVAVGYLNRHVTMMGAISTQVLPLADQMTLLDALAASGDISTKGRSDNILVIREKENAKTFKRLDLTDHSIFYSPYFYLQPNDIVYVEPVKEKRDNTARLVSYITAGISFALLVIDRIIK